MDRDLNLPNLKGPTPPAPRMTMEEYLRFVLFNLAHVADRRLIERQIEEERKMRYVAFRI